VRCLVYPRFPLTLETGNSLAATGTTKTKAKTTKGAGRQKAKAAVDRVISRHFFPSVKAREGATRDVVADLERRQKITAQMLDELKVSSSSPATPEDADQRAQTATGTAIDIPIDKLAGHDDEATLGGNSTKPAANAVLTEQQAVDLKKAVQNAIEQAIVIMSKQDEIDAGAGGQAEAVTDKANADAAAELEAGQITSINAGNAGVGFFQTDVVDSLLGGGASMHLRIRTTPC
jgi:RecA/RadA recombinase